MNKGTTYHLLALGAMLIISIMHLATLEGFVLPWFDEVFFASISKSLSTYGTFVPEISSSTRGEHECLSHGPLYFVLQASSFKLFGFSLYSSRLIACLSGIGSALILYLCGKQMSNQKWLAWIGVVLLVDPFFVLSMHQGRMETTVTFFMLVACYSLVQAPKAKWAIVCSSSFALALLTHPRALIVGLPLLVYALVRNKETRSRILILGIPFLAYSSWILIAFDSPMAYVDYMLVVLKGNTSARAGHLGFNGYIPKHEWVLIGTTLVVFLVSLVKSRNKISGLSWAALGSVVLFYLIIKDWGPYSTLIIPAFYLVLINSISSLNIPKVQLAIVPIMVLGMSWTSIKMIDSFRLKDHSTELNSLVIKPGDKVAGDAQYYFWTIEQGAHFQLSSHFLEDDERIEGLVGFDPGYLFFGKQSSHSSRFNQLLLARFSTIPVKSIERPSTPSLSLSLRMKTTAEKGYSGTFYKCAPK